MTEAGKEDILKNDFAVEGYGRERIEALEYKLAFLALAQERAFESGLIYPVSIVHPLHFCLIHAQVRVRNEARSHKIEVNTRLSVSGRALYEFTKAASILLRWTTALPAHLWVRCISPLPTADGMTIECHLEVLASAVTIECKALPRSYETCNLLVTL